MPELSQDRQGSVRDQLRPAALMVASRIINLAVGLISIPVLIRYLGGDGFAAWAVLLALAAGLSVLEAGMGTALVRQLAMLAPGQVRECRVLITHAWLLMIASFGAAALLLLPLTGHFVAWTGLPDSGGMSAAQCVRFVFAAMAAHAFVRIGTLVMLANRRFAAASATMMAQSLCANLAAMVAVWQTRALDTALIAFWTGQLLVALVAVFAERSSALPALDLRALSFTRLRELARFGLTTQLEGWAQFVNFQFDKFIIAGLVGLWAVAPYEVANRAVQALRSITASAADGLLPIAVGFRDDPEAAWHWYRSTTLLVGWGVVVFLLAPLAVAPAFLYAWTGEMGWLGADVFTALCLGTAASLLAMPSAILMQAIGKPGVPARMALLCIPANILLSLLFVRHWGASGAAVGTACAMGLVAVLLWHAAHRHFGQAPMHTVRLLAGLGRPILICAGWALLVHALFGNWIGSDPASDKFAWQNRLEWIGVAVAIYAALLLTLLFVEVRRRPGLLASLRGRITQAFRQPAI